MKTFYKISWSILITLHIAFSQGPGTAAVPFLLIGPSPGIGAGEAASAVFPTDDSFGFYYNPAQLGVFSHTNNFAVQFYTEKTLWLPQFNFSDLTYNSRSFAAGYVLEDFIEDGIDLNIGAGYIRTYFNLGASIAVDTEGNELFKFNSNENYDAYAIGFGFEYYAYFALGYTYKKVNSNLVPHGVSVGDEEIDGTVDASAHDIGLLVSLPLITTGDDYHLADMRFVAGSYLGYAITNMGDFITYNRNSLGDPLPKTAKLGIGFSAGLIDTLGHYDIKIIELQVANEANDLLIESHGGIKKSYQTAPGDINLIDNVIFGNSTDLVQTQNSIKLNLLESLYFGFHKKRGPGFPHYIHNTSFMISLSGIMKIFMQKYYQDFGKYFDIRYARCDIDAKDYSPANNTVYQSVSFHLKNIF